MKQVRRTYSDMLSDWRWLGFRDEVLSEHGKRCFICDSETHLQVHHMGYKRKMPWEYDVSDIRVYCNVCHETVSRCADEVWNECQKLLPHQIESILKQIKHKEFRSLMESEEI